MLATRRCPACTIHEDRMWLHQWLDLKKKKEWSHTQNLTQDGEPQRYVWGRRIRMVNPRDIAMECRRRIRMVNPRDIAGECRRRRMVNPRDIAVEHRRRRMVNPRDIAVEHRRRRMVNPRDIAVEHRRRRMVNPRDIAVEHRRRMVYLRDIAGECRRRMLNPRDKAGERRRRRRMVNPRDIAGERGRRKVNPRDVAEEHRRRKNGGNGTSHGYCLLSIWVSCVAVPIWLQFHAFCPLFSREQVVLRFPFVYNVKHFTVLSGGFLCWGSHLFSICTFCCLVRETASLA